MRPKTSIVTLTQDRPDFLAEAIASVEAQTDSDWEHLVYDNRSHDPRVGEILRAARARNPDRFFYTSPGGRGPIVPALYWNILFGLARGRYLTILDDDNRKHPEFLKTMVEHLEVDLSLDAVTCGWWNVDEAGHVLSQCNWNLVTSMKNLWKSNTIDSNAFVVRREVFEELGGFSVDLGVCEDWHFAIRLARRGRLAHLPNILLDRRQHQGARSATVDMVALKSTWRYIRTTLFTAEEGAAACADGGWRP